MPDLYRVKPGAARQWVQNAQDAWVAVDPGECTTLAPPYVASHATGEHAAMERVDTPLLDSTDHGPAPVAGDEE